MNDLRKTGIDILGDIPWGTHFCQFYETKEDLLELLVPFFKAGLEHNEYCLWIIADPMTVDDAVHALKKIVPHFQQYIEKKSIEILPYMDWFMTTGKFHAKQISNAWIGKLDEALARGYDGMRVNGNESWLERNGWDNFMEYERGLHKIFKSRRIIGLCTYPLSVADGGMVLDVAHAHEAVIAKRKGHWEILEHPEMKKLKGELQQRGDEPEQRVAERTSELAKLVRQLKQEVDERKKAEEQIKRQIELTNEIIDTRRQAEDELRLAYQRLSYHVANTPLGVIEWDKDLFITRWSGQAEKIFGWKASEAVGKNIYGPDFPLIYAEDKPRVEKIINELTGERVNRNFSLNRNYRKDGSVIYCEWYNSVLRDEKENMITMLSLTHDVTDRKNAEEKLNESYQQIRSLTEHLQNIREEERAYIAREIHDELGQQLTVMKMDISWLSKKIVAEDHAVKERIQDLIEILDATVQAVRKISYELRPHLLDLGLDDAIQWHLKEFEKRSGIKTSFSLPEEESALDDSIKTGLFRIFQESLTNVARHSAASHVHVELILEPNHIILRINDNGRGFDGDEAAEKQTLGILGMKERAIMMGGNYTTKSERGQGTTVMVIVPYSKTEK